MAVQHARHFRFTVEQYRRLAHEGYIAPDARVELIDGEIVEMSPIGERHNAVVDGITELLFERLGATVSLRIQGSIRLSEELAPHPDVAVMRRRNDRYASGLPRPKDILLIIEVADSSLVFDRDEKALRYARYGIVEYWLVDLTQNVVLVHTDPTPEGYRSIEIRRRDDSWTPRSLPSLTVSGKDIFG
ncbi:Uma2 family endonuclease [soil metagenome]